jgi:3-oxoacyl-[acyl-carrier protein] reductase
MDLELDGRCGLVTGASAGIGRAIALALGREGVRLALVAGRADLLETVSEAIVAGGGPAAAVIGADALSGDFAKQVADRSTSALGRVDILVNNAGANYPTELHSPEPLWDDAFILNFHAHRRLTEQLIDPMVARRWGRIINITGKSEQDALNASACAKAAMHVWAKGLSSLLGKHGITVNSIPPGRIMSEQTERLYSPEYRERHAQRDVPVGEYGQPEDIADLVCFLASRRARYITGTVIPVDGGLRRYPF